MATEGKFCIRLEAASDNLLTLAGFHRPRNYLPSSYPVLQQHQQNQIDKQHMHKTDEQWVAWVETQKMHGLKHLQARKYKSKIIILIQKASVGLHELCHGRVFEKGKSFTGHEEAHSGVKSSFRSDQTRWKHTLRTETAGHRCSPIMPRCQNLFVRQMFPRLFTSVTESTFSPRWSFENHF